MFVKYPLNCLNLVIGGDINVSLGISESWEPHAHVDPLADFFLNKIWMSCLIDADLI